MSTRERIAKLETLEGDLIAEINSDTLTAEEEVEALEVLAVAQIAMLSLKGGN